MRTLFAGVLQVPPGHYLIATNGHVQLVRYWDFNYPTDTQNGQRRSDADIEGRVPFLDHHVVEVVGAAAPAAYFFERWL